MKKIQSCSFFLPICFLLPYYVGNVFLFVFVLLVSLYAAVVPCTERIVLENRLFYPLFCFVWLYVR